MDRLMVVATVLAHASLILFLMSGAWLALRWPRLTVPHLVAVVATAAVFVVGADCPLTVWEDHFREAAGWQTYTGGFVGHYVVEPLTGSAAIGPWLQVLIVLVWVVPAAAGHAVCLSRHRTATPA